MAKVEQIKLIDDIDGSDAVETLDFMLDGIDYAIELNAGNAAKMRRALSPYIKAGRHVPRLLTAHGTWTSARALAGPKGRDRARRVRAWARRNGVSVADQGVISAQVYDLYDDALARHGK